MDDVHCNKYNLTDQLSISSLKHHSLASIATDAACPYRCNINYSIASVDCLQYVYMLTGTNCGDSFDQNK